MPALQVRSCVFSTGWRAAACMTLPCQPAMLKHLMVADTARHARLQAQQGKGPERRSNQGAVFCM